MGDLNAGLVSGVHTTGPGGPAAAPPQVILGGGQNYSAQDTGVSIEVLATYDERGVAQWVQNLSPKLAPFAPLFVEHQIEGALFLRLDDAMLREMGINLIGPRARLLEELSRLKAQQRRVRREAAIWEADQFDGRSDWEKFKACNTCFPLQLDRYKLTSAYLVVKRTHQTMCCCVPVGGVFGSVSQTQNSMDLSLIKDIDTSTVESGVCCCATGHDEVYVSTEGSDTDDSETLHVGVRQGSEIMSVIRNAMEENQMQAMVRI